MLKVARNSFLWIFTIPFAFIAMLGEGLHTLPGLGHSCNCPLVFFPESQTAPEYDHHLHHRAALTPHDKNAEQTTAAADCAICKYFSHAKTCLVTNISLGDYIVVAEKIAVCPLILESRFVCSYHSRAPPFRLFQV